MVVMCPVSIGELVDKISILMIKKKNIKDDIKVAQVSKELAELQKTLRGLNLEGVDLFLKQLEQINATLWRLEDEIREKEAQESFDGRFIELARSIYETNDNRFRKKKEINQKYGSGINEVKSYTGM